MRTFKKTLKVLDVSAEKDVQYFVARTVTLDMAAEALLDPVLSVNFDRVVLLNNKAIVQGTIQKNIIYKAVDGTVMHQLENIPFSSEVELPGLNPSVTMGAFNRVIINNNIVNIDMNNGTSTNQGYQDGIDVEIFVTRLVAPQILLSPTTVDQKVVLNFVLKISKVNQIEFEMPVPAPVFECRNVAPCLYRDC